MRRPLAGPSVDLAALHTEEELDERSVGKSERDTDRCACPVSKGSVQDATIY